MQKSPAFQFYPAEFLADENVALMNNQEIGCYMKLMCYCWREGSIPADPDKQAKLCGELSSAYAQLKLAILPCFIQSEIDQDRLLHPRLDSERAKQEAHRNERSESGKRGAAAKAAKNATLAEAQLEPSLSSAANQPQANASSSSAFASSSSKDQEHANPTALPAPVSTAKSEEPKSPLMDKRIQQVTHDAMTAYNTILAQPAGALARVTHVGMDSRIKDVKRCIKVASEICQQLYSDPIITPQFWADYFTEVKEDDFRSGRQAGTGSHTNWKPTFEFLTRTKTMLEVFDKAGIIENA